MALDLGGTNFRVIKLQLDNGRITDETIDYFSVEEHLRFVIKNKNIMVTGSIIL